MKNISYIKKCRICSNLKLKEVISIKEQYLSPTFVRSNKKNPLSKLKFKQTLILCLKKKETCGLLQMKETVNPKLLYTNYFYRSSTSVTMKKDLMNVVKYVDSQISLKKNDIVVDIGANDCTMISYFSKKTKRIGIEPAQNIEWAHVDKKITIINDFFDEKSLKKKIINNKVKVFTACAMFYDLQEPNKFVSVIKKLLDQNGIFVIQLSYLPLMLKNMNFYDICNEHLEYYSLNTLNFLMKKNGLEIFDCKKNSVNGGSVLVAVSHAGTRSKSERFIQLLKSENYYNLNSIKTYKIFYNKILKLKKKIVNFIKKESGLVIGLGASTKGNMLIQLFGIDKTILPYISEKNRLKVGLKTLGTDIELISEKKARLKKPSAMLVLPWYFKTEIVKREQKYLLGGGKLIFPMPYPHYIDSNGEHKI
jgi:hypothetical protein